MLAEHTLNKFGLSSLKGETPNVPHPNDDPDLRLIYARTLHLALRDGLPPNWLKRRLGLSIRHPHQVPTARVVQGGGGIDPLMKLWSEWQELERSTLRALRDRNPRWLRKLAKAIQRNPQTAELVVRSLARKGLAEYDGDGFGRGVVRLTEKGRREARTL